MPAAGLLACGSMLVPAFPKRRFSGIWGELAAYSCGGSHGFGFLKPSPYSLLAPLREPPTGNS